jgi:hypothetical protein
MRRLNGRSGRRQIPSERHLLCMRGVGVGTCRGQARRVGGQAKGVVCCEEIRSRRRGHQALTPSLEVRKGADAATGRTVARAAAAVQRAQFGLARSERRREVCALSVLGGGCIVNWRSQ